MPDVSEQILQCLILDGRASFRRIADVVGVSEQTVARRIRDMHAHGTARVVVRPSNFSASRRAWMIRLRCRPDAAAAVAEALAERHDVTWVALMSGGNEITCTAAGPIGEDSEGVLARIPRTTAVLSFTAQALLHAFASSTAEYTLFDDRLDDDQVSRLRRGAVAPSWTTRIPIDAADQPLVDALARDGRAGAANLARVLDWPASRVSARLEALLGSGTLYVGTDFLPEAFGYHVSAIMYLTVPPGRMVEVGHALAGHRETGFVAATTGPANIVAIVTCRTSDDLFRYVSERVGALPEVGQLDLVPYLRRVKQFGSRVVHGRLVAAP